MTYSAILNEAWQQHLVSRVDNAPTVISTFAGCGGSSLGYSMAGFRELLAVESDRNAVDTFHLNFPDVPIFWGDIAKLSAEECLCRAGVEPRQLDILDGSPPCQGFSTAGKRELDDDRNQLFQEYVRLLRGLQPKVFVMENVSGMIKGNMKLIFAEIMRELKASGYQVSARLLNAKYFYVPQSRERMIFIGVRNDLAIEPSHPDAQSSGISLRQALFGISTQKQQAPSSSNSKKQNWRETKRGQGHEKRFSTIRLDWNLVAPTILKTPGSGGHMHPDEPRLLDTHELQRLASFPDAFDFVGDWLASVNRIGNSVPPLMMRAIAVHIRENILRDEGYDAVAQGSKPKGCKR